MSMRVEARQGKASEGKGSNQHIFVFQLMFPGPVFLSMRHVKPPGVYRRLVVLQRYVMLSQGFPVDSEDYVWDAWLDAWLTARVQPKMDRLLVNENAGLRAKVVELRRELEAMGDIHDNLRQQIMRLQSVNDSLLKENSMLQM